MTKFESMAQEVQADLAKESKREAKGVDWDRYQAVCDELDGAQDEIETLKAKVAELHDLAYHIHQGEGCQATGGQIITYKELFENPSPTLTQIRSIGAKAIREAADCAEGFDSYGEMAITHESLTEFSYRFEAGTL